MIIFDSFNVFYDWFPDVMGCVGAIIILIAYALLQMGKLDSNSLLYSLLNLGGAVMILISLLYSWNLAAAIMEITWIIVSLYGVLKGFFVKKISLPENF